MNRDYSDAEIETLVADAIAAEASTARREAHPPSSAIVWWRAQMRARAEAAKAVERPLTIVHALALAATLGLFLGVVGTAIGGLKGTLSWFAGIYASLASTGTSAVAIDFTSRWFMLPMTAMLVSVVVFSIAAFVIFADE
jgi:hypothetical protein